MYSPFQFIKPFPSAPPQVVQQGTRFALATAGGGDEESFRLHFAQQQVDLVWTDTDGNVLAGLLHALDERDPLLDGLMPGAGHSLDGVQIRQGQQCLQVLQCTGAIQVVDAMVDGVQGLDERRQEDLLERFRRDHARDIAVQAHGATGRPAANVVQGALHTQSTRPHNLPDRLPGLYLDIGEPLDG